jgi:cellulose synthase/poly-beta-1,6-N-acetylglucosamine synthase-like glycosyltransferase
MCIFILNCLTVFILFILGIFSLRRLLFALTTVFSKIDWSLDIHHSNRPFVSIFIPCQNEETVIAETLDALIAIKYPKQNIEIIVIDDLSSDNTLKIAQSYANKYSYIYCLQRSNIESERGKATSLNEALTKFTKGDIAYFIDADHRLRPDALLRLVRHFSDQKVGAVNGRCIPFNKYDSLISSYVYLESLVHHRVTMYASDKLGLAPGVLGSNFCIRRSLLENIGRFSEKTLTEDIDLSFFVYAHGFIIKYDVTSITEHEAPDSIKNYVLQHLRWNRGFNKVARTHWHQILSNKNIPVFRRFEEVIFSLGYLDRLFFICAFALTLLSLFVLSSFHFPLWVWFIFIGLPAFEILIGLLAEKVKISLYFRLPLVLSMFVVDIFVVLKAFYQDFTKKPAQWHKTPRVKDNLKAS